MSTLTSKGSLALAMCLFSLGVAAQASPKLMPAQEPASLLSTDLARPLMANRPEPLLAQSAQQKTTAPPVNLRETAPGAMLAAGHGLSPRIETLDEIVVTASRNVEPLADAIGDITIIGPQELDEARGDSLADILARQPGIQYSSTGGPQSVGSLYLRGTNPQHTLLLLDGMPLNNTIMGSTPFPVLDTAGIERVEILRGSASSLYGSNAIGGVINIISKKGARDQPLSAWANVGYGTYQSLKTSAGLAGSSGAWSYSLSASGASSRGFNSTRPRLADGSDNFVYAKDRDGYRSHAVTGSLAYEWSDGQQIGVSAWNSYMKADTDNGAFIEHNQATYRQQLYTLYSNNRINAYWDSELRFGFAKEGMDDRAYGTINQLYKRQYSWANTFRPHEDHRITVLFEHLEERLHSSNRYDRNGRNTNAIGLIYKGDLDRVHVQASLRNDNYTDYGNQTTGSLGLDFDLNDQWQIGIAGNTGFRAPTFTDLYSPFSDFGFGILFQGNPELKPEKSRNIEAHLTYQTENTRVSLRAYRNRIDNLIDGFVCGDFTQPCMPQNVNRATIRGVGLTASHRFDKTTLWASADFMDPHNDSPAPGDAFTPAEGKRLPNRARQVFHLGVQQQIQAWTLGAEYQYTGSRYTDTYNNTRLGGYSLLNLTAAYDINSSLRVDFRWNNVLNKDYVVNNGYATSGSNVFVNLSWRM